MSPAVVRYANFRYAPVLYLLLGAALTAAAAWFCWRLALPPFWDWAEVSVWRIAVFIVGVPFLLLLPFYPVVLGAMAAADIVAFRGEAAEETGEQTLEDLERAIEGSTEPLDYARYSRKALRLYYDTGHNQVRLSFYVGVGAMLFGFAFLLAGLALQVLDTSEMPWIRANPDVQVLAVGGGLVIEFVAATFLWTYRAAIVQLNVYYRRQMLIHSGLLTMSLAQRAGGEAVRDAAMTAVVKAIMAPSGTVEVETPRPTPTRTWMQRLGLAPPAPGD